MRFANLPLQLGLCLAVLLGLNLLAAEPAKEKPAEPPLVKKILKVDFAIQESLPPNLVVTATGEVNTGGYDKDKVTLTRVVYVTPPADGMQEYHLRAVTPEGIVTQVISKVEGRDTWKDYLKEAPWIKGVRVLGMGKGIVEKKFAEAK